EVAGKQPCRLADLNEIAVGISHVTANLGASVNRGSDERGAPGAPLFMADVDIGHTQVQEDRSGRTRLGGDDGNPRLCRGRWTTGVHDDPGVGQLHYARVLLEDHSPAENLGVELARAGHPANSDK